MTFELAPTGPFGLPEEGKTVIGSRPGDTGPLSIYSPVVDSRAFVIVSQGTLSNYRSPADAIDEKVKLGRSSGTLHDNFLNLEVESPTSKEALNAASEEIDRFLRRLTLNQGRAFSWKLLVLEDETGQIYPLSQRVELGAMTFYNTAKFAEAIEDAQTDLGKSDERLERALEYYEHAVFLYENRLTIAPLQSQHFRLLISGIFLNLWKAVTAIIGDPSVDKDYQRRYRQLGFDDQFFKEKIETIRELRNDFDVAHYTLDAERLKDTEAKFGECQQSAAEIVKRYRINLGGQSEAGHPG
jgi:hypothetical protein